MRCTDTFSTNFAFALMEFSSSEFSTNYVLNVNCIYIAISNLSGWSHHGDKSILLDGQLTFWMRLVKTSGDQSSSRAQSFHLNKSRISRCIYKLTKIRFPCMLRPRWSIHCLNPLASWPKLTSLIAMFGNEVDIRVGTFAIFWPPAHH